MLLVSIGRLVLLFLLPPRLRRCDCHRVPQERSGCPCPRRWSAEPLTDRSKAGQHIGAKRFKEIPFMLFAFARDQINVSVGKVWACALAECGGKLDLG